MKTLEKTLKAVANQRRLAILDVLMKNRELNVKEIAALINLSFKSTSRHLAILASLEFVDKEQRRLYMYYSISKKHFPLVKFVLSYIPHIRANMEYKKR